MGKSLSAGSSSDVPEARKPEDAAERPEDQNAPAEQGTAADPQRAALESAARLQALVEASPLGICIMDLDGNPFFYNTRCEELHGISFKAAAGKGWNEAVHPDDRKRVAGTWYAAAAAREKWSDTYRFRHPDGRIVWVSGRTAPIYVEGRHIGFVGTLEDITEFKAAQAAAEHAVRARDEMLAVVAHELRNPLQSLATGVEALLQSPLANEERLSTQLALMRRTARKMAALIGDLLDVSQMEAGSFSIKKSSIPVAPLLDEAVESFAAQATEQGIELTSESTRVPPACGDRVRLAQVLSNLIENALKFTPPQGRINVRARKVGEHVQVSVEDTGPGVPIEIFPHIFDRFYKQGEASIAGTGLGLTIAKGIVEAHHGAIWAEAGRGAKFHFTVPSAEP